MELLQALRELNDAPQPKPRRERVELLFLVFVLSCFAGWIYEEIFYFFAEGALTNRGFLFGPWLPVYGFGAVLMLLLPGRVRRRPAVFFALAMLVTGVLEYATGRAMYAIWRRRWWDYTGLFCNLDGYVCLRSVLTFALGGLALVYVLEPLVRRIGGRLPQRRRALFCAALLALLLIDLAASLALRHSI